MSAFTLAEFAARMIAAEGAVKAAEPGALEYAATRLEQAARSYPGHYQTGWRGLKPETIVRKATGNSPLLETGELRESYEHVTFEHEAYVGSNNMKAVWQEMGTSRGIPPRPVLGTAAVREGPRVARAAGKIILGAIDGALGGGGLGALREVGRALHEVGETAREFVDDDGK